MNRDNNTSLVSRTVQYGMTALLAVQLKTKLLCYTNQVVGLNLWKKRTHAATWMGLMMTSSVGTGSEWAFKLSIYTWTASVMF